MRLLRAAGVAALGAYAFYEPFRFRVMRHELRLKPGRLTPSILHISDTHLSARDEKLMAFLTGLPEKLGEVPDLVIATGDLIEGNSGIDPLVEALARLESRLGRFYVLGSHDYFYASGPAYARYFVPGRSPLPARRTTSEELEKGLQEKGWVSLKNRTEFVATSDGRIRLAGVDDPHLRWHDTAHIETDRDDALALALVHAPDVVSEWVLNGFDVVLAGHTHGGQVRIPGIGAVVTNSSLPAALAAGPHQIGNSWLHVSPGLGNGRFSPIRFACRPEATFLKLVSGRGPSLPTIG